MKKLIILICIITAVFLCSNAHPAFKIYLKNGRIISGVDAVKKEDKVRIYKNGIMLELQKADIIKIEEYEAEPSEKETVREKPRTEEELPEYLRYEEQPSEEIPEPAISKQPEKDEKEAEEETETITKPRATERQRKRLEELEKAGKLPESAKPYKEFLDKLHKQKKLAP